MATALGRLLQSPPFLTNLSPASCSQHDAEFKADSPGLLHLGARHCNHIISVQSPNCVVRICKAGSCPGRRRRRGVRCKSGFANSGAIHIKGGIRMNSLEAWAVSDAPLPSEPIEVEDHLAIGVTESSHTTSFPILLQHHLRKASQFLRSVFVVLSQSLAYALLAATFVLFINVRPARAAWGRRKETPVVSTTVQQSATEKPVVSATVQQFAKEAAPTSSAPGAPIDWGRSLPEEEEWPLEEREGLEGDLREHDIRDSQIDHAFEVAETSESDENQALESNSNGERLESGTEKTGHHWEGDLPAYDRQLKEIKAAAEKERRTRKRVISWPLRIASVRDSHPQEWMKIFPLTQGKHVAVSRKVVASHADLLKKLAREKLAKKRPKAALLSHELVSIGGAWLKPAVQQGLLTPLPFAQQSEWWERVGPKWRRFVTRNSEGDVDSNGSVYAVPYRFGHLVIAYRSDMLDIIGGPIEDWQDLFRPELQGRIAMLGAPQEVVGIVLKSLGASANVRNFDREVPGGRQAVVERYLQLRKQVRVFGDVQYAPALRNGDVLAAVGWSDDFRSVTSRISAVKTVTPASGTLIWADFWGVPSGSDLTPVSQQWLDYCLQPERAKGLGAEKMGLSPLILPPFPETPIPGLPLNAQLASASSTDWKMAVNNRHEDTAERRQSAAAAGPSDAAGRARFNGLYAPRMAVSAQVAGVGKGPFEKGVTSGQLPRLEVLERSDLLEPLDEQGRVDHRWLLSLMEETETENLVQRVKRKWGEAVETGRGVTKSVRTKVDALRDTLLTVRAS